MKNLPLFHLCGGLITLLLMNACAVAQTTPSPPMTGSDRDIHGCIGSAGYSWCERENHCERPWELAKDKGFANTESAFNRYCRVIQ